MKYNFPHTINNGAGEELTFLRLIKKDEREILEIENKVLPGSGPPMHIHWLQDESITVVSGKLGAQIAGEPATFHKPGDTIIFHRGVAHRFWNAGEEILICTGWVSPAHNLVYFLTEIYRSVKLNGGHRPSMFDGAYLQTKYRSEFDMVEIPRFVKKVLFPLILMFGKAFGKHRKFADAPDPVHPAN